MSPENPSSDALVSPSCDPTPKTIELLEAEVRSLRTLFNIVLLSLIVLMASLFSFMWREIRVAGRQISENSRFVAEYKRKMEPRLNELQSKLSAYSKFHPNFTPIYVKYFGATNTPVAPAETPSDIPATLPAPPPAR